MSSIITPAASKEEIELEVELGHPALEPPTQRSFGSNVTGAARSVGAALELAATAVEDTAAQEAAAKDCGARWGGPFVSSRPAHSFLTTTTMHGFQRIFEPSAVLRRLFWVSAFAGFAVLFFTLTVASFQDFLAGKTVTTTTTSSVNYSNPGTGLPLPGLTICPVATGLRCDCSAWLHLACTFDPEVNLALYNDGDVCQPSDAYAGNTTRSLSNYFEYFLDHQCVAFHRDPAWAYNKSNCRQVNNRFLYHDWSDKTGRYELRPDSCGMDRSLDAMDIVDLVVKRTTSSDAPLASTGRHAVCPHLTKKELLDYSAKRFAVGVPVEGERNVFTGAGATPWAEATYPDSSSVKPRRAISTSENVANSSFWSTVTVGTGFQTKECTSLRIPQTVANQTSPGVGSGLRLTLLMPDGPFSFSQLDLKLHVRGRNAVEIYFSTNDMMTDLPAGEGMSGEPIRVASGYDISVPLVYEETKQLPGKWNRHQDPPPLECNDTRTTKSISQCHDDCRRKHITKACQCPHTASGGSSVDDNCPLFPLQADHCYGVGYDDCYALMHDKDRLNAGVCSRPRDERDALNCKKLNEFCPVFLRDIETCINRCQPPCTARRALPLTMSTVDYDPAEVLQLDPSGLIGARGILTMDIGYASLTRRKSEESPAISLSQLLGTLGGNLGLWCGMSFMTVIEVLEFLIVKGAVCRTRGCRDKKRD